MPDAPELVPPLSRAKSTGQCSRETELQSFISAMQCCTSQPTALPLCRLGLALCRCLLISFVLSTKTGPLSRKTIRPGQNLAEPVDVVKDGLCTHSVSRSLFPSRSLSLPLSVYFATCSVILDLLCATLTHSYRSTVLLPKLNLKLKPLVLL